jgi:hypothetical protein
MATLNQYADKFTDMVNQRGNHILRQRIKDSIKQAIAMFVRQSIEKHGIDDILKLSYDVPLIEVPAIEWGVNDWDIETVATEEKILRSEYRIPYPVRFQNDAPFTYVGLPGFKLSFAKREYGEKNIPYHASLPASNVVEYSYSLKNSYLYLDNINCNEFKYRYIIVETIWENPDEIVSMYSNQDGDDMQIPLPYDLVNNAVYSILKTEFNIVPIDETVPVNKPIPAAPAYPNSRY